MDLTASLLAVAWAVTVLAYWLQANRLAQERVASRALDMDRIVKLQKARKQRTIARLCLELQKMQTAYFKRVLGQVLVAWSRERERGWITDPTEKIYLKADGRYFINEAAAEAVKFMPDPAMIKFVPSVAPGFGADRFGFRGQPEPVTESNPN